MTAIDIGTITWFKSEDLLPPKQENKMGLYVLCYYGANVPVEALYYYYNKGFQFQRKPSHWAFINLPE